MYTTAAHDAALIVFMAAFGEWVLELINSMKAVAGAS